MPRITLLPEVEAQLNEWLNETDGLIKWLSDSTAINDPNNNIARITLGGLTEVQFNQAQVNIINLLMSDRSIVRNDFTSEMVIVAENIRNSYNVSHEYFWTVSNFLNSRTKMRDLFNVAIDIAGLPVIAPILPALFVRPMGQSSGTQYTLPNGNDGTTNWTQGAGDSDGDWFDELDEGFGAGRGTGSGPDDDSTYWISPTSPANEIIGTTLASVTDPEVSTGHIVRSRNKKDTTGGRQIDILLRLKQSSTSIATATFTDIDTTWTTRSFTLTGGEADSITDYSLLRIETEAIAVGGGQGRNAWESAHEFECPDAGPGATSLLPRRKGHKTPLRM